MATKRGRPKKEFIRRHYKTVTVRLTVGEYYDVKQEAVTRNVSMSEAIRRRIIEYSEYKK